MHWDAYLQGANASCPGNFVSSGIPRTMFDLSCATSADWRPTYVDLCVLSVALDNDHGVHVRP